MKHNRIHFLGKKFLANAAMMVGLGITVLLAIPTLLLIGAFSLVWSATDRVIRWVEK